MSHHNGSYENTLDVMEGLMAYAQALRVEGWEVNFAAETGNAELITFSAKRPLPPEREEDEP